MSFLSSYDNVHGVDDTREVTQDGQNDVKQQCATATGFQEDTQWWKEDGGDELEDIRVGKSHCLYNSGKMSFRNAKICIYTPLLLALLLRLWSS